jgi:hypothetical protein
MIQTPIGLFRIVKNEHEINYKEKELPKKFKDFEVDKRYQIEFDNVEKDFAVEFILETQFPVDVEDLDSDEDLFYAVYNYKNLIIGIGVEGDIPGIKYEYVDRVNKHGIKIIILHDCQKYSMKVNVAWQKVTNREQIINVQLAVDPAYYV